MVDKEDVQEQGKLFFEQLYWDLYIIQSAH